MPSGTPSHDLLQFVVVVPVMRLDERTTQCLEACAALPYAAKIICVVSDVPLPALPYPNFVYIATGTGTLTSPAFKRDIARVRFPDADIYANLDDDAYPPPHWLEDAVRVLAEHPHAAGAGGPGLDPPDQTFWERLSSAVLQTRIGSGPLRFRFWPDAARDCDDFPSHNLFVRKQWLDAIGGWSTNWNGGEDTLLCARLANKGGLIRYDPGLGAFHYRRRFVPGHLRQMFNFGRSRGCFIRAGEERSMRMMFVGPLAFAFGVAALACTPLLGVPPLVTLAAVAVAFAGIALFGHPGSLDWRLRLLLPFALVAHHCAYASGMLYGIATGTRTVRQDPSSLPERGAL